MENREEINSIVSTLCKFDKKGLIFIDNTAKILEAYINYDNGQEPKEPDELKTV